jgi:tetratricopeptide (TPR) repeat protein
LALSQLDSLIVKDKGNYALWYKKGQVSEHAGDTAGAITYYNAAISIYPSVDGLLALANLYAETKNPKTLNICVQINELGLGREYDAYTTFFVGVYFSRTGNKDKALLFFDKSISNNYTFMESYLEKGYVYFDTKKYDKALEVFKMAAEVKNRFADAYYWQGKCYEALNQKSEAVIKYQQALGFDNSLTEAEAGIKRLQ